MQSTTVETPSHNERDYEIFSGRGFFGENPNAIDRCLKFLPSGLILDLGAAIGSKSQIYRRMSPDSRVFAFEPYPGNWPHFEKKLGGDPSVRLIKKAVANVNSHVNFHVGHIVSGTDDNWTKGKGGYSSIGRIVQAPTEKSMKVPTCRIDDVVQEHVSFMKLDIQGGEYDALLSASNLFENYGVDILFCEFSGDIRVLDFLGSRGFMLMDHQYLITPVSHTLTADDLKEWCALTEITLSTGQTAYHGWPNIIYSNPVQFADFISRNKSKGLYIQTDIVAVHKDFYSKFLRAFSSTLDKS
tara:strand:+ start:350 stop:1246 length:897 start_codon:yes stop_codon:yes gene_type:complete